MSKFLKGNELNSELEKVFENAESQIILVSPYIKLHDRYKSVLIFREIKSIYCCGCRDYLKIKN